MIYGFCIILVASKIVLNILYEKVDFFNFFVQSFSSQN